MNAPIAQTLAETLIAYQTGGAGIELRPAKPTRPWMDALPQAFAYRCLPLNIANSHGWELLCPGGFSAEWNGGAGRNAIEIRPDIEGGWAPSSHFGTGIITFHPGYLFRTDPGYNLFVTGSTNRPKDAVAPLSGIIETDWSPYSFTMNWAITRPDHSIRFEKNEPFCFLFPVQRGYLDHFKPEIQDMASDPETRKRHQEWSNSRRQFNADLAQRDEDAIKEKWQKAYYRGEIPGEGKPAPDHQIKLGLRPFADSREAKRHKR